MSTRRIRFLLCALTMIFLMGCGKQPMSFTKLKELNIFPQQVGENWTISGEPSTPNPKRKGYIHAQYSDRLRYGSFKVWVIDKGSAGKAEEWLRKLFEGELTTSSIRPLPGGEINRKSHYQSFVESSATIMGETVYENVQQDDSGINGRSNT